MSILLSFQKNKVILKGYLLFVVKILKIVQALVIRDHSHEKRSLSYET